MLDGSQAGDVVGSTGGVSDVEVMSRSLWRRALWLVSAVACAAAAVLVVDVVGVERSPVVSAAGLQAGVTLELQVAGRGGVPGDASAVVLNVTVTQAQGPGFVTVFPCGSPVPNASNVNYVAGSTVPNAVVARVGANGRVCVFTYAATDLIVDVDGWFPAGASYVALQPARLLETRSGPGLATVDGLQFGEGPRGAGSVTEVQVAGRGGVPGDASAVVLNVTVTQAQGPGFVTVFPCGSPVPNASNVNYVAGRRCRTRWWRGSGRMAGVRVHLCGDGPDRRRRRVVPGGGVVCGVAAGAVVGDAVGSGVGDGGWVAVRGGSAWCGFGDRGAGGGSWWGAG